MKQPDIHDWNLTNILLAVDMAVTVAVELYLLTTGLNANFVRPEPDVLARRLLIVALVGCSLAAVIIFIDWLWNAPKESLYGDWKGGAKQ